MTDVPPPSVPTGPNYGPDFGAHAAPAPPSDPAYPGSIPQRAPLPDPTTQTSPPQTRAERAAGTGAGRLGPASARRNRIVGGALAGATLVAVTWFVANLGKDTPGPITLPSSTTATSPGSQRPTTAYTPTYSATYTDRAIMPTPTQVDPSTIPVVNITPGARVVRFEAYAAAESADISFGDDTRRSAQLTDTTLPWAAEIPVSTAMQSSWISLTVRAPYVSGSTRPDVVCRVLVDGVVVSVQQSQGYASCYISPKYDIRRT